MKSNNPKRARIGDIIEIETPQGLAYAQYTHFHSNPPRYGALIRVLPGLYGSRPARFDEIVREKERFSTFFPLNVALERGVVTIVAHEEIPERCKPFPLFKAGHKNPATGRVETWWLWDGIQEWKVGELTPQQRELPLQQIWNDTLLIERIVQGWAPADEM